MRARVDAAIEAAGLPERMADCSAYGKTWRRGSVLRRYEKRPGGYPVDTTLVHYSQLTLKGVFHTTPQHVNAAFEMLKMGAISAEDFVQNEYCIEDTEKAIVEHASGKVIKNCIVYK